MIVFDFDGVIADSLAVCRRACIEAAARQEVMLDLCENPFSELDPLTFGALATLHGLSADRFTLDVANAIARESISPVFTGMAEILRDVARRDQIVILSASTEGVIRRFLEFHGLREVVSRVIGIDSVGTKAVWLAHLLKENASNNLVMVGDAVSDFESSVAAHVPFVGVSWGWQSAQRLESKGVDGLALKPSDLPRLITRALRIASTS